MAPYQYPQVPRGTNTGLSLQPPQPLDDDDDNRFSWVATPAEAKGRIWKRQSDVPALPTLPSHLSIRSSPPTAPLPEIPVEPARQPTVHQQQPEALQERRRQHHASQRTPLTEHPEDNSPYASSEQTLTPQTAAPSYSSEQKPTLTMSIPQTYNHSTTSTLRPSEQYDDARQAISTRPVNLAPDENPLTPTTPAKSSLRSPTTNIPVIAPSPTFGSSYAPQPQPDRGGTFQHSFFSCSNPSICIPSLFCPCVTYGRTQYRLELRSEKKDPTNMLGYHPVNGSCLAFGILCGINSILAAIQHTRIRKAYEMDGQAGNVASDCLKGLCCCCCMVAQDEKEMKLREEECRRTGTKEGYVAPSGMVFQPPPR